MPRCGRCRRCQCRHRHGHNGPKKVAHRHTKRTTRRAPLSSASWVLGRLDYSVSPTAAPPRLLTPDSWSARATCSSLISPTCMGAPRQFRLSPFSLFSTRPRRHQAAHAFQRQAARSNAIEIERPPWARRRRSCRRAECGGGRSRLGRVVHRLSKLSFPVDASISCPPSRLGRRPNRSTADPPPHTLRPSYTPALTRSASRPHTHPITNTGLRPTPAIGLQQQARSTRGTR